MKIQNVHSNGRKVWLFERNDDMSQKITTDESYFPYYYERDPNGAFTTYDNQKARVVTVINPYDIVKRRTGTSYEADVQQHKRYIVDKIASFDKCPLKAIFFDIETLATDLPDPSKPIYPVSCISTYNTANGEYKTWYLGDYNNQNDLLLINDFAYYVKDEAPDALLAWNINNFDYPYLFNRYAKLKSLNYKSLTNFATLLSPIDLDRHNEAGVKDVRFPAGISILDYLSMFKKVHMREQSYALDKVAQKHLNDTAWGDTDFATLSEHLKEKNINDVRRMVKLEELYKLFDYFDEIRRFATCLWEDLWQNSRILDMVVLREAHKRQLVLPNKPMYKNRDDDEQEFEGAYRRADAGVYESIYKADVSGMYPAQMINFCLDGQNLRTIESENTINIDGLIVEQNPDALVPYITKNLVILKDKLKEELGNADPKLEETKKLETKYNAIKGLVNSMYGTIAFGGFRLYNVNIASRITYLARTMLKYVEDKISGLGMNVIYTDTDALMYHSLIDECKLLNKLTQDWAMEIYGKEGVDIRFDSEGVFDKLLILSKCHYYGYITGKKGRKCEIKGLEMKRASSSKYEGGFQKDLIEKVINKEDKNVILEWIKTKIKDMPSVDLMDVSYPCKIANKDYVNTPIFVRAYEATQKIIPDFKLAKGELFRYIYVKDYPSLAALIEDKEANVLVVSDKVPDLKKYIDWDIMIERNIISKAEAIFTALGWGYLSYRNSTLHISKDEADWKTILKTERETVRAEKKAVKEAEKQARKVAKEAERMAKRLQDKQKSKKSKKIGGSV